MSDELLAKVVGEYSDMIPKLPTRGHSDDAGVDLYAQLAVRLKPGERADVPFGVAVELPKGTWGMLVPRSSTWERGLMSPVGVIDVGYRGELFGKFINASGVDQVIKPGERMSQLIIMPNCTELVTIRQVTELSDHPRGTNGFGSTGK